DSNGYALALIENIQREDLNPLEMAEAFKQMLEECQLSQEELAKTLGKSRSTVTNIIRLNNLQEDVKKMVVANQIDLGHAKVLLSLEDPDLQLKAALYVIKKSLNVRQTEELVKNIKVNGFEETKNKKVVFTSEKFGEWEKKIRLNLSGIKAKFKATSDSKGKLTLAYSSIEQLESLLSKLEIDADVKDLNVTPALEDNVEEENVSEDAVAEDISTNDTPAEEPVAEDVAQEEAPAEELTSDEVVPEEAVSEEVAADEVVPEEAVTEEVAADEVAPEEAVTEEVAADEVAPEKAVTEEVAADEVAPEEVVTEEVAADEVAPEEAVTEEVSADEVATEKAVTEEIAADEVTPEDLAAGEISPEVITEEVISEDVNLEELMSETPEEK
ncbi:MAG: ParB/RepB/Spo0J family partition protein, partial [Succinivibrio dextrinosolvens]|nr:ParB/RepB/Spo0J family partition protein [Succinivibrio dextrinosolvens]